MNCVLFDLDGTLANVRHRLHHVRRSPPDWQAFFDACVDDTPNNSVVSLFNLVYDSMNAGFSECDAIFICSGRPDSHLYETVKWLNEECGIYKFQYEALLMRAEGDYRPDVVVKREMLSAIRRQGYEPCFAVDDRPSVVAMWRANGVPCFAVDDAEWKEPQAHLTGDLEGRTLLTLMVGPSHAGKSRWLRGEAIWMDYIETRERETVHGHVEEYEMGMTDPIEDRDFDIEPQHILSSDQLRRDLLDDESDQSRVFAALHDVARIRLRHGLPTVIDATHLRRKDRLAAVDLAPAGTRVRYVVIDRPLEEKLGDLRPGFPTEVILRHDQTFRSQLKDILAGDGLPHVDVVDLRSR